MGIFLHLVEMRRWFTLAGLALILVGVFTDIRPIFILGFALIALQFAITIWSSTKEAKANINAARALRAKKAQDQSIRRQSGT